MSQDEIRKLVGGYATGTLTEAERKALFAAALDDQDLFDELAREQDLKELLDSPGARTRLTAVLAPPQPRLLNRLRLGIFGLLAAGFAVAVAMVFVVRKPAPQDLAAVTKTESQPPQAQTDTAFAEPPKQNPSPAVPSGAPAPAPPEVINQRRGPLPSANNSVAPIPPPVLFQPPPEDALKKSEAARRDEPDASAKALADQKDSAPPQKAQTAQAAESVTVQNEAPLLQTQALPVQQGPSGLARQQAAQAPRPVAAAPPAVATNGAIGALSAGRAAGFAARVAPPRFAFNYTISHDSLTVHPLAAGYLQVTASVARDVQVVLQQASRQEAGTSVTMPIPAGSQNLIIEFSATLTVQAASLDNLQGNRFREKTAPPAVSRALSPPPSISKDKTGHVEEQTPSPNPRLSITVAVPLE